MKTWNCKLALLAFAFLSCWCAHGATLPAAFLKANGFTIRDQAGQGQVMRLRGYNLGGWLCQEDWMCPTLQTDPNNAAAVVGANEVAIHSILTQRFGLSVKNQLISTYQNNWINVQDLDNIAAHGMNLIRVPFCYLTLMEEDGTSKADADAFDRLDWIVAQAWARGIYVILDFHVAQGYASSPAFWQNDTDQTRTVQIWQRVAQRYAGNPAVAGYDLLNEPVGAYGTTQWAFMDRCYRAIRAVDPDHLIFIEATWHIWDLPPTDQYGWSNVCYSFHWYNWGSTADQLYCGVGYDVKTWTDNVTQGVSGGKEVPAFVGEFSEWDAPGAWRQALREFTQNSMAWTSWTYKGCNIGNWALYNVYGAKPNVSVDTADAIAAKWQAFATTSRDSGINPYLRDIMAAPIASDAAYTLPAGGSLAFTASSLLANTASLSPSANLRLTEISAPLHGQLVRTGGLLVYTPAAGFVGTDTFTYRPFDATNGLPASRPATVSIVVGTAVAVPGPYVFDDRYETTINSTLRVLAPGVLSNDGQPAGHALTAQLVTAPASGTLALNASGAFVYTPASNFDGEVTFTYRALADGVASAPATVTIQVKAPQPLSAANGLTGSYYTASNWTGIAGTRVDPAINFSWDGSTSPGFGIEGIFSIAWDGWLTPPFSGVYTFTQYSDDAMGVYINGAAVVQDWSAHGSRAGTGTISLAAGQPVHLQVYMINYGGPGVAQLFWQHPLVPYAPVPTVALTTAMPTLPSPTDQIYPALSAPLAPLVAFDGTVAPQLSGTVSASATLNLTVYNAVGGFITCPVTAGTDGRWTWPANDFTGGIYTATVSLNASGIAGPSSPASPFTVGTLPMSPTVLTAVGGTGNITLSWPPVVAGANGYLVLRSDTPTGTFSVVNSYVAGPSYTDVGLADGHAYSYQVVGLNYVGGVVNPSQSAVPSPVATASTFSTLQNWRLNYWNTIDDAGDAADLSDPDGDGVPNLVEYALGGIPVDAASRPSSTIEMTSGRLQMTFDRLRADITYSVQGSNDLTNWVDLVVNPGMVSQTVSWTDSSAAPCHFLRLKITRLSN